MIKELAKQKYDKLSVEFIQPAKNLYKEVFSKMPELEFKTSISTLDEFITTESTIEGIEFKKIYTLKANIDGNRFNYKHTVKEEDDLDFIKSNALKNYDAWKLNIEQNKNKTIENG
jgi:hypothetical protein